MIFDLDGVIADTHPIHTKAWQQLLLEYGRSMPEENWLDAILEGRRRDEILSCLFGDLSAEERARISKRKDELFFDSSTALRALPGVPELLLELESAGVPMAVASSGNRARCLYTLEKLRLTRYFRSVLTGDDVAEGKPNPSIFRAAAQALNTPAQQSLVAEDSVCGVRAAVLAGIRCLGVASDGSLSSRLTQQGADHVVSDFRGLSLPVLRSLF